MLLVEEGKMDFAVAFGALYMIGKGVKREKAGQAEREEDLSDLKLAKKPPEMNGREQFLYDAAASSFALPGTARIKTRFRRARARSRREVENIYDPILGNVHNTLGKRDVYERARGRTHRKREDFKDREGFVPETFAAGVEDEGRIWRSELTRDILSENRAQIAQRVYMPGTSKKIDGLPGRLGTVSAPGTGIQRDGAPMKTAAGEVVSKRTYINKNRFVLSASEAKRGLLPQYAERRLWDTTYENRRLNVAGLYRSPYNMDQGIVLKPSRRNAEQEARKPVPSSFLESDVKGTRALETHKTRKLNIQLPTRPVQDNVHRNPRSTQPDISSRNLKKVEEQPRLVPMTQGVERKRPHFSDFELSSKQGLRIVPENRRPAVGSERFSTLPIRGIETGAAERDARRDLRT